MALEFGYTDHERMNRLATLVPNCDSAKYSILDILELSPKK